MAPWFSHDTPGVASTRHPLSSRNIVEASRVGNVTHLRVRNITHISRPGSSQANCPGFDAEQGRAEEIHGINACFTPEILDTSLIDASSQSLPMTCWGGGAAPRGGSVGGHLVQCSSAGAADLAVDPANAGETIVVVIPLMERLPSRPTSVVTSPETGRWGVDDYDSLLETLDILSSPDAVAAIREGPGDVAMPYIFIEGASSHSRPPPTSSVSRSYTCPTVAATASSTSCST